VPDQLIFLRTKDAFNQCIVVAVALPTHAHHHPATSSDGLIETRAMLVALIAMMHEPWGRVPTLPGHQPGLHDHRKSARTCGHEPQIACPHLLDLISFYESDESDFSRNFV
jgi:hypothetical protein